VTRGADRPIRRALIVHTGGGLGDLISSTPIADAIARRQPGAAITWWAAPAWAPLLEGHPFIQEVWTADPSTSFLTLLRAIRERRFDLAVLPWTTGRQVWLTALAGVGRRVGQGDRLAYSWLLTHRVSVRSTRGDVTSHWTDVQLDYARAMGCDADGLVPVVRVTDANREAARAALAGHGVAPHEHYCVLHIGKGLPIEDVPWPCGRFIEIGRALRERYGWRVVLTGSQGEAARIGTVCEGIGRDAVNLAGRTTLCALAGVLESSEVCVAVDSGPMHLAAAVGASVVGLFAIKSDVVERWRPLGTRSRTAGTGDWSCARTCVKERCPDYECMGHLDVEDALSAVDVLVGRPGS
jgi:heptosyltransferase I